MIHTRLGNADAAEIWLEIWQKVYTNAGHGTLHDVDFAGVSLMGAGARGPAGRRPEIMQIEAGMSCVAAIQEMLLHVNRGVSVLFKGAPLAWNRVAFSNMRTEGAFLVSAARTRGRVGSVKVRSLAGGVFRLANPWTAAVVRRTDGRTERLTTGTLEITMKRGETVRVTAVAS